MRKIIPYIAFFCLTGFTATSSLPLMAGSCSSHINKKEHIKCDDDNTECQTQKVEKLELNKTIRS